MPVYEYVARRPSGEEAEGTETATNPDALAEGLKRRGLLVVSLAERDDAASRLAAGGLLAGVGLPGRGVSVRRLALFTRQLATMIRAGLPLLRGLQSLARDEKDRRFRTIIDRVAADIQNGQSFSDALGAHPAVFSDLYTSMVRAGERSGQLEAVLKQLADYLEKLAALKARVKSALAYPAFVTIFAAGAVAFLLLKVIPTFAQIYSGFGSALPAPTAFVLHLSVWLRSQALLGLGLASLAGASFVLWKRSPGGAYAWDAILLRVPLIGPLIRDSAIARFSRTLASLLRAGLPVLEALDLVRDACGNRVLAHTVASARGRIASGAELAAAFTGEGILPQMLLQLMATGQETGTVDEMLAEAADFAESQVDAGVATLTSLIEPVLIVLMGAVIGSIVITMFLPIFNLGRAVGG